MSKRQRRSAGAAHASTSSMPIIMLPDNADIKTTIASLKEQLRPLDAQRNAILGAITSLQQQCPHKNARRGRDISGGPDGQCYDCGYSW